MLLGHQVGRVGFEVGKRKVCYGQLQRRRHCIAGEIDRSNQAQFARPCQAMKLLLDYPSLTRQLLRAWW